ncbi:MAG: hypothetical protein QNJ47_15360 [Nostocaceae cyanobacterium]|nr:hypothetical protein [Nostocaceae cyanobacterium]
MSNITIVDIKPAGVELFADSESFIKELSDDELNNLFGGLAVRSQVSSNKSGICCIKL